MPETLSTSGDASAFNLEVRRMREDDLDNGYFESLSNLKPSTKPVDAMSLLRKLRQQGSEIFVATLGTHVVGAATVMIEQKLIGGGLLCAHIEDVATRKGFERRGIGRAVIAAAVDFARTAGCYKIVLDCTDENAPFYESAGFKRRSNEMILKFESVGGVESRVDGATMRRA